MTYSISQFKMTLHNLGYSLGPDGLNGNHGNLLDLYTQSAIQEFQAHFGLLMTGKVDQPTSECARQLIRNLQHRLNLTTNAQLPINEFYGPRMIRAVMRFQQLHDMPMTGIAGSTVRQKLNEEVKQLLRQRVCAVEGILVGNG
ncbi:MAG: peptidoglycan-binding protein [Leptolyngbyaceae cyanobacterium RM2_2_4]|nr:peptidoglycan-binding protein [Leptolyngbyaceae cyanobacterium SM1_4_3]NJO48986.1 peptidoglycan-binding protein [Leptolyngbyaceae cyanobacterium RM2_2_4]